MLKHLWGRSPRIASKESEHQEEEERMEGTIDLIYPDLDDQSMTLSVDTTLDFYIPDNIQIYISHLYSIMPAEP
jgi:hypothetical protein